MYKGAIEFMMIFQIKKCYQMQKFLVFTEFKLNGTIQQRLWLDIENFKRPEFGIMFQEFVDFSKWLFDHFWAETSTRHIRKNCMHFSRQYDSVMIVTQSAGKLNSFTKRIETTIRRHAILGFQNFRNFRGDNQDQRNVFYLFI